MRALEAFFQKLHEAPSSLLILDYDGTLAPFVENPEQALPYPGIREKIEKIMQKGSTRVVILSGRALKGVKRLLSIHPHPELWGSHGGERLQINAEKPMVTPIAEDAATLIQKAAQEASRIAPRLYCEVKPLSAAVHWRGKDPKEAEPLIARWKEMSVNQLVELHFFDGGVEIRPQGVNKGTAVNTLLNEMKPGTVVAYLGDDLTDEEAFEALGERGLKVLVRKEPRPTKADVLIHPPEELNAFLERWLA